MALPEDVSRKQLPVPGFFLPAFYIRAQTNGGIGIVLEMGQEE
jgi:hypothetical protein